MKVPASFSCSPENFACFMVFPLPFSLPSSPSLLICWQGPLSVEHMQESEIIELDSEVSEVQSEGKDRKINSLPVGDLRQPSDL